MKESFNVLLREIISKPSGNENLATNALGNEILLLVKKDDPFVIDKRMIITIDSLNELG